MHKTVENILFKKVPNPYIDDCYDWFSDELAIPFLNNSKLRIRLAFNDQDIDNFKEVIATTLKNTLALRDDARVICKEHLYA